MCSSDLAAVSYPLIANGKVYVIYDNAPDTFGINLIEDAKACDRIRAETAPVLKINNL